jgi:hypothetical protein
MDEGFTTFISKFSEARQSQFSGRGGQILPEAGDGCLRAVERHVVEHNDFVMDVPPDRSHAPKYIAFTKPCGVLQLLRRDVMGPELFEKGVRLYIQRWANKHPTPEDFFRTMDAVAGRRLDWFWREWFYETPGFDQAIDSVSQTTQGGDTRVTVVYGNRARGVLPVLARFTFSDGTKQDFIYAAESWKTNSARYVVSYTFSKKTVTKIELDPDDHLVDTDRANNVWTQ